MNSIVQIRGKEAFTTSEEIARGVGHLHKNVKELISKHSNTKTLSPLATEKVPTRGRPKEYYILDEQQATFLMTLMSHSPKVTAFKEKLVSEFFKQRRVISELIARQKDPDWIDTRKTGISVYHQKTNIIKEFVEYAEWDGSTSANRYYANFARMENSALFFFEQKYKNLREVLTIRQLMQVATADTVIEKALKEGMDQQLPYKECFQLAKARVIAFVELIGKSPILSLTQEAPKK